MAESRFYPELRQLQKRANQRLVRLERLGVKSPAYEAAQARLEILGRQTKGDRGRRFSETGRASYNEYEHQMKVLNEFLGMQTSTQKGTKEWIDDIWETASAPHVRKKDGKLIDLKLKESGITKEDWLEFWKNMPNKQKDRAFGSEVVVRMLRTYTYKNKQKRDDQKLTMAEIAEEIQASKSISAAHEKLGISYKDIKKVNSLGGNT